MPSIQNISLLDREATPVAHAFVPRDVKNGVGYVVRSTGVPISEERLTVSMRKVGTKFRGKLTLAVPVVVNETINGVVTPKAVRTAYANIDITFDEMSTTQERTNLIGMLADSLGVSKVLVHNCFVGLEGVYGS